VNKFVKVIKKIAIQILLNDDTKKKVITALNKKINIPMISEEVEAELMESMYEAMQEALTDAIVEK